MSFKYYIFGQKLLHCMYSVLKCEHLTNTISLRPHGLCNTTRDKSPHILGLTLITILIPML